VYPDLALHFLCVVLTLLGYITGFVSMCVWARARAHLYTHTKVDARVCNETRLIVTTTITISSMSPTFVGFVQIQM